MRSARRWPPHSSGGSRPSSATEPGLSRTAAFVRRLPLWSLGGAAAASVVLDAWLDARDDQPPVPLLAALDWAAHLGATALALRALPDRAADRLATPALLASIAIDADHLPIAAAMLRGEDELPRPRPHTFATPALLAATRLHGAAFGTAVHLARDLFNGPGVAVAWPARPHNVRLPVVVEAVTLAALFSVAWRRSR